MSPRAPVVPRVAAGLTVLLLAACTSIAPFSPEERSELDREAQELVAVVDAQQPGLAARLRAAPAFAVFPDVGRGAAVVGLAYGKGVLYDHGRLVGYCDLTAGSLGLSLGGQGYSVILCLETPTAVWRFKHGVYTLSSQANAVLGDIAASAQSSYDDDVSVLILDELGLMLEASLGTQELRCQLLDPGDVN